MERKSAPLDCSRTIRRKSRNKGRGLIPFLFCLHIHLHLKSYSYAHTRNARARSYNFQVHLGAKSHIESHTAKKQTNNNKDNKNNPKDFFCFIIKARIKKNIHKSNVPLSDTNIQIWINKPNKHKAFQNRYPNEYKSYQYQHEKQDEYSKHQQKHN